MLEAWAQCAKLGFEILMHFAVWSGEGTRVDENEATEFLSFARQSLRSSNCHYLLPCT
jgi:hypothetical protein